eukprot:COSAG04_NODE_5206_length_1703_cov_1.670200_2_plen_217_part_00
MDALEWGTLLLDSRHVGAIRQPAAPRSDHSVAPRGDRVIRAMDEHLLAGVFSDGAAADSGWLMVVDLRTSVGPTFADDPGPRNITLDIHPHCTAAVVPGGRDGWYASLVTSGSERGRRAESQGSQVTLRVHSGGGALLRLTDSGGSGCGATLRSTRQWWFDPREINLKHSYPETGLKAATYAGSQWMPQEMQATEIGSSQWMSRDATGQGNPHEYS